MRFVVDESSWNLQGLSAEVVEGAMEALLDRLETARARNEVVALYDDFYEFDGVTPQPYALLFEHNEFLADRDLRARVSRALDRLEVWAEEVALDVEIGDNTLLAPSIARVHHAVSQRHAAACLPLHTAQRAGPLRVIVDDRTEVVHFVTDEAEHRAFFRDTIEVEDTDNKAFSALAASAFPDLQWADDVWGGLRDFSKPFREMRPDVTHHLGVLDEHGPNICRDEPRSKWQAHFGAHGVTATGENGRTMKLPKARADRTRIWRGEERVFWWHTKIEPHRDRIHFLYDEEADCVVVGIYTEHCWLP